jgi:exosortase A
MLSEPGVERTVPAVVAGQPVRAFASVAAVLATVAVLFWPTTLSMVRTWSGTITFNHCFFVPPVVLWLIWRRRFELASVPAQPYWPAAIALGAAGALWLLANLASAVAPAEWAMTAMVPLAVATVFGIAWVRVLAFPLLFLFFAVPFGEVLVPTLIDWTADFTTIALQLVGVPVLREGNDLTIPSGRWAVVEACSGVRFLIASVVAGCLYAHQVFRSPLRRAAFVAASIVVPIVANWLRAFMIVLLGHISSNRIATGVDHLVYGWFFFALVLFLLLWAGTFWREDDQVGAKHGEPGRLPALKVSAAALTTGLAVMLVWPILLATLAHPLERGAPPAPLLDGQNGWKRVAEDEAGWRPALVAPSRVTVLTFAKDDQRVGIVVAQFRDQSHGRDAASSQHRFVSERDLRWRQVRIGTARTEIASVPLAVRGVVLAGDNTELRVWQWYWSKSIVTSSEMLAKVSLAADRLRGQADDGAWIAIFAVDRPARPAEQALDLFAREMGPALHGAMQAASTVQ